MDHKPAATDRKISSGSVRRVSMLFAKKQDEKNKENCSRLNAQWILDKQKNIEAQEPNRANDGKSAENGAVVDSMPLAKIDAKEKSTANINTAKNQKRANDGKLAENGAVVDSLAKIDAKKKSKRAYDDKLSANTAVAYLTVQQNSERKRNASGNVNPTPKQNKTNVNKSLNDIEGTFIKHSSI